MTDTLQRNVVNISQFDRSRRTLTPAEALALLHACRDQTIDAVCGAWQEKGPQVEDTLLANAAQSPTLETRNLYYAAQEILHNRGEALALALRNCFLESLERQLRHSEWNSEPKPGELSMELSLVDEEDFEQSLALSKAASRLRFDSVEELAALDQRIAALLRDPQARDERNPLGATAICQSFLSGCEQLGVGAKVKLVLLQQFGQEIARKLPKIYQQLNQFLVSKDILPSIRVGLAEHKRRSPHVPDRNYLNRAMETGDQQDVFRLLQQLVSRAAGTGPAEVSLPPASLLSQQRSSADNPIHSLTQLQHGVAGTPLGVMPAFDSTALQSGAVNILRDIRAAGLIAPDNHADAFTIDIVAMLFDYIFDDRTIPDKLKALIGRLQIPVLKVAMLDKQFFSKKSHPARRLLDEIAAASIGWSETGEYNARLYDKLDNIVHAILEDFSDDVGIFSTLLNDLLTFLSAQQLQTQSSIESSTHAIEAAERTEIARIIVADEIRRVADDMPIPEPIREFLLGLWQQVLIHTFIEQGEQSPAWKTHLQTMRDLVWSVTPKRNTEDRLSLVVMLPDLLKHLREGMNSVQVDPKQRENVFSQLVTCHAAAVKAGLEQQGMHPSQQSGSVIASNMPAQNIPSTTSLEVGRDPYGITNGLLELDRLDDELSEDEYTELARSLQKGDWLEFDNDDGSARLARLSWISSMRGIYLFTNNEGMDAITVALPRLAARLRNHKARLVEVLPLTERAVEKLILDLQDNAV